MLNRVVPLSLSLPIIHSHYLYFFCPVCNKVWEVVNTHKTPLRNVHILRLLKHLNVLISFALKCSLLEATELSNGLQLFCFQHILLVYTGYTLLNHIKFRAKKNQFDRFSNKSFILWFAKADFVICSFDDDKNLKFPWKFQILKI